MRFMIVPVLVALMATAAMAVSVTLPDTSQTTVFTANVSAQAAVVVPAGVSFAVTNVASSTASAAQSVTITNVCLVDTQKLKISLQANSAAFTPPAGTTTWNANDVSWNAATWTNATGAAGTLSNAAYNAVATSSANPAGVSTAGLTFTLAANATPNASIRNGAHTLTATWKFESVP